MSFKMALFQVLNSVASATLFNYFPMTIPWFSREWYPLGATTIFTILSPIGDGFVMTIILDLINIDTPVKRWVLAPLRALRCRPIAST